MARPDYCRFMPGKWRSSTLAMTWEQEGLLIRICAFNMDAGVAVPPSRTTAARMLGAHRNKLDKVLDELIAMGEIVEDETGIYSQRAMEEHRRATRQVTREIPHSNPIATPELPQDYPEDTPQVEAEKSEQLLRARRGEEKREEEKGKKDTPLPPKGAEPIDALTAFEAYNATALRCGLPQASKLTPQRSKSIRARLKTHGLDGWMIALANIEKSAFLCGQTDQNFRADLDFVCQAKSFDRLHDGGYGNGRHGPNGVKKSALAIIAEMEASGGF